MLCSHQNTFGFALYGRGASASMAIWRLTFYTDFIAKTTSLLRNSFFCKIRKLVNLGSSFIGFYHVPNHPEAVGLTVGLLKTPVSAPLEEQHLSAEGADQ